MKYKKIALIGMMGSGKSAISKLLSKKTDYLLAELDEIFEQEQKLSIKEYFKNFGEKKFRTLETKILKSALQKENIIISTGGGIILEEENRNLLNQENILTVYLETSAETIYNRIQNDTTRPLLQVDDPKKEIENILNQRIKYYSQAKIIINTDNKTIEEITEEIKQWIK